MDETDPSKQFPLIDLIPKREIEALSFVNLYPEYDGRGVTIAILDTGVDPLAKNMQVTSDGKPKIIDNIDTSGSGDVETSTLVKPDESGYVLGLTGRRLKIPDSWKNISSEYRVGVKPLFELLHSTTKKRVLDKRKQDQWDEIQSRCLAALRSELAAFEGSSSPSKEKEAKTAKEDLLHRLKFLEAADKKFPDAGPVLDVVTWNDGSEEEGVSGWCVCVDTSFTGDLEKCKVLRPYKEKLDVGRFSEEDFASFTVEVYCNGDITCLVTTGSPHGTHVASIAAACDPKNPELSGVAPGARIISIKIGDTRLKTEETGTALCRAIDYCVRNNVDIINYSFGEPAAWHCSGRIYELIQFAVFKHNILFVSSAGNNGPGLRTAGAPGATVDGCIGVAAYLSPAMKKAQYAIDSATGTTHYTWSSRGPCTDGYEGVTISAPGAGYASIPLTTLSGEQLMNGTSMASPNAAGGLALVLSGLKARGACYSSVSIRRSIRTTAAKMPNHCPFSSGPGSLQVNKAFEHAVQNCCHILTKVHLKPVHSKQKHRGILLHKKRDFKKPTRSYISIGVEFPEGYPNEFKVELSTKLSLLSSQSWTVVPSFVNLSSISCGFWATVNADTLPPGCHFAEILAYDAECPAYGPLFRFPVSVLKPEKECNSYEFSQISLKSGQVSRRFLRPPRGASYAVIKVKSLSSENTSRLTLHCLQLPECTPYSKMELEKIMILEDDATRVFNARVVPEELMEVTLAQQVGWTPDSLVDLEISFHGLELSHSSFSLSHFEPPQRVDIQSLLEHTSVNPSVALKYLHIPLRPSESKIAPLSPERGDVFLVDKQVIYTLELTYNYTHAMKEKEAVPRCPYLAEQLYESFYECQMWMMFDSNKQLMGTGDSFPSNYSCQLEKGDYVIKLWVRSPNHDDLDKMKSLPFSIAVKLGSPLSIDAFTRPVAVKSFQFSTTLLAPDDRLTLYLAPLPDEKLPKEAPAGSSLTGMVTFVTDDAAKKVDNYPISYSIGPPPIAKKPETKEKAPNEKTFSEAMRDAKVSFLQKKEDLPEEDAAKMYEELISEYPDEIPIYMAYLSYLAAKPDRLKRSRSLVITLCEEAVSKLPREELLQYFGTRADARDDSVDAKEMLKKRTQLIDLLQRQGCAFLDDEPVPTSEVEKCWNLIRQLVDIFETKSCQPFVMKYLRHQKLSGFLLHRLTQELDESSGRATMACIAEQAADLGWTHVADRIRESTMLVRHPPKYPLL